MSAVRVYRFYDKVAVTPPNGPTFYLSAAQAADLSEALANACEDVTYRSFGQSTLGTHHVACVDPND